MDKEIEVSSIKITMGKKEVELSIEKARKLKKALEEIFGTKVVEKTEHIHHYDYWPRWNQVYYQSTKFDFGTVYCSSNALGSADSGNLGLKTQAQNQLCLSIE